ncbi:MarR family winged helix-turn-helix transcriptional regulator [Arhodomonas sp. AD133]|uniref:MarR family winged helix-turn-helix transcriptional regulator n=1 Tax=Arhodomonas sp. AD133 TaxID=3415009 RepID=UPI003EB9DF8D
MSRSGRSLVTDTVLTVFQVHGRLIEWGDSFVAPFGLTSSRWQMLGALALADTPLTTPRIAEAMGVTRQGARKQLSRLISDGLVEERTNPHHQRSPLYALTPAGQALYVQVEARWNAHADALAQDLDPADLEAALRVLRRLHREHVSTPEGETS